MGILVIAILGPGSLSAGIALVLANIPRFIRFMRASV
jgi:ABC-type dipeptide/oligopeptide/nickel transport system permease subunit